MLNGGRKHLPTFQACTYLCAYLSAFLCVPVLLFANISVFISNSDLRQDISNGKLLECKNAIDAIAGFIGCYTVFVAWLCGIMLMKMHTIAECIDKEGLSCEMFMEFYNFVGLLCCGVIFVFNIAVTYWLSLPSYIKMCGSTASVNLNGMIITDVFFGHIIFDTAMALAVYRFVRWYQWL